MVSVDKKDFRGIANTISKYKIDYVFDLAAQTIVETAYQNPFETFATNIMGTVNVLESARLYGNVSGIIVISSDKAYGKIPKANENSPLSGDHPYETSKASADLIAKTYFKTYKMPIVTCRFGNVYGEGDTNFSRIIPGIMRAIVLNQTLRLRSDGQYIRDYVYVKDIIDALILVLKNIRSTKGESFNVSSKENLSVIELIKILEKTLGRKINYKILNIAINEIPKQSIDYKKISTSLNWKPKYKLSSKVQDILSWYSSYHAQ
ncbi:MAG: hypothetical protein US98_C0056G0006 [Parcubacteria group bacterium GW2011_GWC1_38_6]|nr:MAG: hypothetical protein US98_C0056G0006 [Parcubacteria group bacterium GW2011_GWC1_38_6]